MKQGPDLNKVQENMKPGAITLEGFLGTDDRNLVDILIDDAAEVRRLGLTHKKIARKMKELRDSGTEGLGEFVRVEPNFEVKVDDVRGKLPSPFGGPGLYRKRNTTVVNTRLDKEITFTDLHIHMIEENGFYEGKGSRFRLDPKDLAEILELI
jgi:hypothetical protein